MLRRPPLSFLTVAAALALATPTPSQNLVADLNTTGGYVTSSVAREFCVFAGGSRAAFIASGAFGSELYVTDGTAAGTQLLADLSDGYGSLPGALFAIGSEVLFTAIVPGLGRELWKTDGTPAGTVLVKDIYPGATTGVSLNYFNFCELGGLVYFIASGVTGSAVWRTDGTTAGTVQVIDMDPGFSLFSNRALTVVGNRLYFTADDGTVGWELYSSDGTQAGTSLVADLTPGPGDSDISTLAAFGNLLVFSLDDVDGPEPWISDGTAAGTFQLADLYPGSFGSEPEQWTEVAGRCVFSAQTATEGRELFITDGTTTGTQLLANIATGSFGSSPDHLTSFGNIVLFEADGPNGREPYRTDGTVAGTFELADLIPGVGSSNPGDFVRVGTKAWFSASDPVFGGELFETDGTPAGTNLLGDFVAGTNGIAAVAMTPFGAGVLCRGGLAGAGTGEPCFCDGTLAGTFVLADIGRPNTDSAPDLWLAGGNGTKVAFAATADLVGRELFVSDGTPTGTQVLVDVVTGSAGAEPLTLARRGDKVFLDADLGGVRHLHVYDITASSLTQLTGGTHDVRPQALTTNGNRVLFSGDSAATGRELWVSNGTVAGTSEVLDIQPGSGSSIESGDEEFATVAGLTYFAADDGTHGVELWATDGTPAGTYLVADLNPGAAGSYPDGLTVVGDQLIFAADEPSNGRELWRTNGTAAGTMLFVDLRPGGSGSTPESLVSDGASLYFVAASSAVGRELWVTDMTPAGTVMLHALAIGPQETLQLVAAANGVFFFSDDLLLGLGLELWFSDGTPTGTAPVRNIGPGAANGPIAATLTATFGGTEVMFVANDLQRGLQLWRSNGSSAQTQPVTNFGAARVGAARIENLYSIGARTFFACDDGDTGLEPWVYDAELGAIPFVMPYGTPCAGPGQNVPTIGSNSLPSLGNGGFAITLSNVPPLTIAVPASSVGPNDLLFGNSCKLWLDVPIIVLGTQFVDAAGNASSPLPVPADPNLIGSSLFFQWAVYDPGGPFLGDFTLTGGLQMQMGI